jgi:hypothetical protein
MQGNPENLNPKSVNEPANVPMARATSQETEISLDLLLSAFGEVVRVDSDNSTINVIEKICGELANNYVRDRFPDLDKKSITKKSEERRKRLVSNFISALYRGSDVIEAVSDDRTDGYTLIELVKVGKMRRAREAKMAVSFGNLGLSQIGLSLELEKNESDVELNIEGVDYTGQSLEFNLQDGKKFISFLSQINRQNFEKSQFSGYLQTVAASLTKQLLWHYDLAEPNSEALELLANLDEIVKEYQRLDQGQLIESLDTCNKRNKEGILKEYVLVYREGLSSDSRVKNNPAFWYKNYNPIEFRDKWSKTLNNLRVIRKNPKASEIYSQLKSDLLASIDPALSEIYNSTSYGDGVKLEYIDILFAMKGVLKDN